MDNDVAVSLSCHLPIVENLCVAAAFNANQIVGILVLVERLKSVVGESESFHTLGKEQQRA